MLVPNRKQLQRPNGHTKTSYLMPDWLVRDLAFREGVRHHQFSEVCTSIKKATFGTEKSVKFRHLSGDMKICWEDDVTQIRIEDVRSTLSVSSGKLGMIVLAKKMPASWRRELMVSLATMLQRNTHSPFTDCEIDVQHLVRIIEDPIAVEKEALEVWNRFVDDCQLPSSFLVSARRPINLYQLIALKSEDKSGMRHVFAEKFPWVAGTIIHSQFDQRDFFAIDSDPSSSKYVAAKHVCCRGRSKCQKAQKLVKRLVRNSENGALDQLLNDINYRQLLLEAHNDDSEIISHIGKNISLAKRQLQHAFYVNKAYLNNVSMPGSATAFYLATLLARMMIRNRYDPDVRMNHIALVKGLAVVSADSLSVFFAKLWNDDLELTWTNSVIDEGVLALLKFIGRTNPPRLTAKQLIQFASSFDPINLQQRRLEPFTSSTGWFMSRQWDSKFHEIINQNGEKADIQCLIGTDSLINEGIAMQNCLRDGGYISSAIEHERVFISIVHANSRATLALEPTFSECDTRIVDWSINQLKGKFNEAPHSSCKSIASEILAHFKKHYCIELTEEEMYQRDCIFKRLHELHYQPFGSRYFFTHRSIINTDEADARSCWNAYYSRLLPRSLSNVDPESIVEEHLASLEKNSGDDTCEIPDEDDITIEEMMDRADSLNEQT